MTTEDDFQKALDAQPDDWQTRLVFADWLQERDDPRAEGYRALGSLTIRPRYVLAEWLWHWSDDGESVSPVGECNGILPRDWFTVLPGSKGPNVWPEVRPQKQLARREVEDAAALAFAKLPPERRAELLAQEVLS